MDLAQRRQQLRQKQVEKVKKFRQSNTSSSAAVEKQNEKEQMKKEIKQELSQESINIENSDGVTFARVMDIVGPTHMKPVVSNGLWKGTEQISEKKSDCDCDDCGQDPCIKCGESHHEVTEQMKDDAGPGTEDQQQKQVDAKQKKADQIKKQVLLKKLQAVRQGGGENIVASYDWKSDKNMRINKVAEGSLHKWFKGSKSKDGKGGWVNVVTGGTCASDEPGEGTPKCVSSSKRASMTKAERESASKRKKEADPGQQSKSGAAKPTYVATDKKESYEINPAAHKAAQKKSKMRNLARGNENPNEKAAAQKKAGGPKLVGEDKVLKTIAKELDGASKMHKGQAKKIRKHIKSMEEEKKPKNCGCGKDPCITYGNGKKKMKEETTLDEKCWAGYTQKGMKKKGKKVVPNCVPVGEAKEEQGRSDYGKASVRNKRKFGKAGEPAVFDASGERGKMIDKRRAEHKAKRGVKEEVVTESDKKGKGSGKKDACYKKVKASASVWPSAYASGRLVQCRKKGAANYGNSKSESYSWRDDFDYVEEGAAWTKKSGKNKEGGLNEKGRKSYERENPGSDLKAPQPEGGSRKKSFCARMGGMKKKLTSSKTANDPDSRINKALRKWKC